MCDALFFDARELRAHFVKSQAAEFASSISADILTSLVKSPDTLTSDDEQIISQHKKLHLKSLISKHIPFESSAYVRNNEMMNVVSFKKLQYTTRCYTLALMNTFTSSFKLFKNSNPQTQSHEEADSTINLTYQPLICPECGLSFDAKTRDGHVRFRHHLIYECFFTLKHQVSELKCAIRSCSFSTDAEQQMVAHWSQSHLLKRLECCLCASQSGVRYAFDDVKNRLVLSKYPAAVVNG